MAEAKVFYDREGQTLTVWFIDHVEVTDENITAHLVDGRVISVPLAWSWRLSDATPAQRANWTLIGDGHGVHWPDVDEDLSADGMLNGVPARRPGIAKNGRTPGLLSAGAHRPQPTVFSPASERTRSPARPE